MTASKTIDTLVEDIYKLFDPEKEVKISEEELEAFADGIKAAVVSALTRKKKQSYLRLSMIGKPDRQIWNELNSIPKEELSSSSYIKFLYGDILEQLLIFLCKTSGHDVKDHQKELEVNGVVGHQDATIDGVMIDFKSASPHGFRKFKDNTLAMDDPFGYIGQISSYAFAADTERAGFLAIEKVSGEIALCEINKAHRIDPSERIEYLKRMVSFPNPPPKCYDPVPDGKSGNMKLATGCHFCDFKKTCWADANNGTGLRAFNYSNGIRYFTEVNKTPDVEELDIRNGN
jgi:hypothetical protein